MLLGRGGSAAVLGTLLVLALAGCGGTADAERVSNREQRGLPISPGGLVQDLCFRGDSSIDRHEGINSLNPAARRQFKALEASMRRHPNAMVQVEFAVEDSPDPVQEDMTVRELAETHLEGAKDGGLPNEARCFRRGRARLERLLRVTG